MSGPFDQCSKGKIAMKPYKVIQWGTGAVGAHALKFILGSSDLELVGLKCYTDAKAGRDAGEIAGVAPVGVAATKSTEELLKIDADCVVFMPLDALMDPTVAGSLSAGWVEEVIPILASGKNVVSSIASGMHYRQLAKGGELVDRLNKACVEGHSSIFFTGIDPGFVSDCLAITMSSVVGEIEQIRTWEIIDYATYPTPSTMESLGFGKRPDQLSATAGESLIASWGCAPWLMADALGVELDEVVLDADIYLSPYAFTAPGGTHVEADTIGALRWSLLGKVNGQIRVSVNHVNRMGADMAPDWPTIGDKGGYRVEIDAMPPFRGDFPLGLSGGTGTALDDAVAMTAARCVNAIHAVVQAHPGYLTLSEIPTLGGRHSLTGRSG
jgi:2,4-diaminopentanoate dehydrogenase